MFCPPDILLQNSRKGGAGVGPRKVKKVAPQADFCVWTHLFSAEFASGLKSICIQDADVSVIATSTNTHFSGLCLGRIVLWGMSCVPNPHPRNPHRPLGGLSVHSYRYRYRSSASAAIPGSKGGAERPEAQEPQRNSTVSTLLF